MNIEREVNEMDKTTVLKMNLLGGMHEYMNELGDDTLYERWIIFGVPHNPTEEDLKIRAEDEEVFAYCCRIFGELVNAVSEDNIRLTLDRLLAERRELEKDLATINDKIFHLEKYLLERKRG